MSSVLFDFSVLVKWALISQRVNTGTVYAKFAIYREVEQREVTMSFVDLQANPNRPYLPELKRRFLSYQLAFVPRYLFRFVLFSSAYMILFLIFLLELRSWILRACFLRGIGCYNIDEPNCRYRPIPAGRHNEAAQVQISDYHCWDRIALSKDSTAS